MVRPQKKTLFLCVSSPSMGFSWRTVYKPLRLTKPLPLNHDNNLPLYHDNDLPLNHDNDLPWNHDNDLPWNHDNDLPLNHDNDLEGRLELIFYAIKNAKYFQEHESSLEDSLDTLTQLSELLEQLHPAVSPADIKLTSQKVWLLQQRRADLLHRIQLRYSRGFVIQSIS